MTFAEEIKITRQRAFLSQEAFAKEINSSVASINRWENGRGKPNLTTMKHIKEFCEKHNLPYEKIECEWLSFSQGGKELND